MGLNAILQYVSNPSLIQTLSGIPQPQGTAASDTLRQYNPDEERQRAYSQVYDPSQIPPSGGMSPLQREQATHLASVLATLHAAQAAKAASEQSDLAGLQAKEGAYALAVPQQEEMRGQGAFPRFNAPDIPQRGPAQVDPTSQLLAGIAAGLAPGHFSGGLLASPLEGALTHAQQVYNDQLKTYQMRYEQAAQQHEDDLAARNEEAKRLAYNASTRYGNELGSYKKAFDSIMQVGAPKAALEAGIAASGGTTGTDAAERAAAEAQATEQGVGQEIRAGEAVSKQKVDLAKSFGTQTERYYANLVRQQERAQEASGKIKGASDLETQKQTGRVDLQKMKGDQLWNRMQAHEAGATARTNSSNATRVAVANARNGVGGAASSGLVIRKEIALQNAIKTRFGIMTDYAKKLADAKKNGIEIDPQVSQIYGKNFEAAAQAETTARAELDTQARAYRQDIQSRSKGGSNPVIPGAVKTLGPPLPSNTGTKDTIDQATATTLMRQVGNDPAKAAALAYKMGYRKSWTGKVIPAPP